VLLFELFKHRHLLHFVRRGQPLCLLRLVEHHLFDNASSFIVQISQLAIFGLNLLGIDLFVTLEDTVPPVLTLLLSEIKLQDFAVFAVCLDTPRRLFHFDWLVKVTLENGGTALYLD
jgi:hypothetical protein